MVPCGLCAAPSPQPPLWDPAGSQQSHEDTELPRPHVWGQRGHPGDGKAQPDPRTPTGRAAHRGAEHSPGPGWMSTAPPPTHTPPGPSPPLTGAAVLLGQQVVGEGRRVGEALQGGVEEARVAQVVQPGAHPRHPLPPQGQALGGEQHLLRGGDPIPRPMLTACGHREGDERRRVGGTGQPPHPHPPGAPTYPASRAAPRGGLCAVGRGSAGGG